MAEVGMMPGERAAMSGVGAQMGLGSGFDTDLESTNSESGSRSPS